MAQNYHAVIRAWPGDLCGDCWGAWGRDVPDYDEIGAHAASTYAYGSDGADSVRSVHSTNYNSDDAEGVGAAAE